VHELVKTVESERVESAMNIEDYEKQPQRKVGVRVE
jgi:hypothetical protein